MAPVTGDICTAAGSYGICFRVEFGKVGRSSQQSAQNADVEFHCGSAERLEHQITDRNGDSQPFAHEVSDRNKDCVGIG